MLGTWVGENSDKFLCNNGKKTYIASAIIIYLYKAFLFGGYI